MGSVRPHAGKGLPTAVVELPVVPIVATHEILPLHVLGRLAVIFLAVVAVVILAGIVVNNAILIVHQMLNNIKAGMGEREALLLSCQTRLRPIMMTVISSVFGMMPLAFGEGAGTELYRGMGTALIGGLSISTLFTLFLVPVLISLLNDMGFHTKKEDLVKELLH